MTPMWARALHITDRWRPHENQVAGPEDFTLVEAGEVDARTVLADPGCTLYCLDFERKRALFVKTPPEVPLFDEVFLYQAQHRYATQVFALRYDDLLEAAREQGSPRQKLVLLYSVGRCGSTLLARALQRMDGVFSLSEPDVPTQLAGVAKDPGTSALLEAAIDLLCRPPGHKRVSHCVIKLRAQGTALVTTLHRLFPASQAFFLYRNAVDVVRSYLRAFHPLPASFRDYHDDPVGFFARFWRSRMLHYVKAREQGVPILALRYEDLVGEPGALLAEVARRCGLSLRGVDSARALFGADAQDTSNLSRRRLEGRLPLDLDPPGGLRARICEVLAGQPMVSDPYVILPGTWLPATGSAAPPPSRHS